MSEIDKLRKKLKSIAEQKRSAEAMASRLRSAHEEARIDLAIALALRRHSNTFLVDRIDIGGDHA